MLREGFGSAEVDMEQRTLREARVDAERLVLATRSALATDGDLLNADERASIEQRMAELDLQQARYEASLAERRYAACDPENRLIAAQLEKSWEAALQRVQACEARLNALQQPTPPIEVPDFVGIARDLTAAWNAPGVTMRARRQLLRALVVDIIAQYDEATREITLTIHWRGGQHSRVRVQKPKSGEHGQRTSEEALAVMRSMACRWSDADIAASLNRMGIPTGQGKTWNARRVESMRILHDIRAYRSAEKDGEWLTMTEAAKRLDVTNHHIRWLIKEGILPAQQVVPRAPYQIRSNHPQDERVTAALARKGRPRRAVSENQTPLFSNT